MRRRTHAVDTEGYICSISIRIRDRSSSIRASLSSILRPSVFCVITMAFEPTSTRIFDKNADARKKGVLSMPFFDVGTTYAGCRDARLRYIDTSLPIAREREREDS